MLRWVACTAAGATIFALCCPSLALGQGTPLEPTASVIVVRPAAWRSALEEWIAYRSSEYRIVEIDSGTQSLEQLSAIRRAAAGCSPPAVAVVLCGDVARDLEREASVRPGNTASTGNRPTKRMEIVTPSLVLDTAVRLGPLTTPSLCTDALFGDLDNDGCPDLSVGRLPAKSPQELEKMLHRSILYERAAPGPWNDTVHVTAGVGGFGIVADTAIETVTRRFLTEGIPDHFHLNMTYASCTSTYCPNPMNLRESYIGRINGGGLFWVYIGHGSVTHLDYMQAGNEWLPIGEPEDAQKFHIRSRPPIALILACFTGAFDANVDCFAERLLLQDSGPIAVIAGSRVTMPYGLSQLASEMINGCFRDRIPTLGEVVLQAKRRIWEDDPVETSPTVLPGDTSKGRIDIRQRYRKIITDMALALNPGGHDLLAERREHVRLMNLLGDPLLKIPYPDSVPLSVSSRVDPGSKLQVRGTSPISGALRVELALVRDRLPEGIVPIGSYDGTLQQQAQMQSTYESSNEMTVVSYEQMVAPGDFLIELDVPSELKGRCVVAAYVYGQERWAVGSERVTVRRQK